MTSNCLLNLKLLVIFRFVQYLLLGLPIIKFKRKLKNSATPADIEKNVENQW